MFTDDPSGSDPNYSLTDDLVWIADAVDVNPAWLRSHSQDVYASLRAGLESKPHYTSAIECVVELIALVVTDDAWKEWFDPIADMMAAHPIDDNNLFEKYFREVVADFRGLVGVYGRLNRVRPAQVDALLQAYIRLFKALIYKHGLELPKPLIDQSLHTASTLDDHIERSRLNHTLALYFLHYGDFPSAEAYARLALNEYEFIEDPGGALDAALSMAVICRNGLRFARAEYFVQRVIDLHPPTHCDKRLATLCYEYAANCYVRDEFAQALDYYQQALGMFEALETPFEVAMCHHALSLVYIQLGNFAEAERLILLARQQWEALGNLYDWVSSFFVEADLELKRGERSLGVKKLRYAIDMAYTTLEDTPARENLVNSIRDHIERHMMVAVH
ncbi:MAG: tetratricopeptide repeat protein [Anaerolineae bacterium]|nr:tetratricopeptide repeat protein [Anaerolineae bacterium]